MLQDTIINLMINLIKDYYKDDVVDVDVEEFEVTEKEVDLVFLIKPEEKDNKIVKVLAIKQPNNTYTITINSLFNHRILSKQFIITDEMFENAEKIKEFLFNDKILFIDYNTAKDTMTELRDMLSELHEETEVEIDYSSNSIIIYYEYLKDGKWGNAFLSIEAEEDGDVILEVVTQKKNEIVFIKDARENKENLYNSIKEYFN